MTSLNLSLKQKGSLIELNSPGSAGRLAQNARLIEQVCHQLSVTCTPVKWTYPVTIHLFVSQSHYQTCLGGIVYGILSHLIELKFNPKSGTFKHSIINSWKWLDDSQFDRSYQDKQKQEQQHLKQAIEWSNKMPEVKAFLTSSPLMPTLLEVEPLNLPIVGVINKPFAWMKDYLLQISKTVGCSHEMLLQASGIIGECRLLSSSIPCEYRSSELTRIISGNPSSFIYEMLVKPYGCSRVDLLQILSHHSLETVQLNRICAIATVFLREKKRLLEFPDQSTQELQTLVQEYKQEVFLKMGSINQLWLSDLNLEIN